MHMKNIPSITCAHVLGLLFAIASTVFFLLIGIFMLIPVGPFTKQDIDIGITLIMLSIFGIIGCAGYILGVFAGACLCLPCSFYEESIEKHPELNV